MSSTLREPGFCERVGQMGSELETLRRCQVLGATAGDPTGEVLAELEKRHADLRQRAAQIDATLDKADQSAFSALEADLEGIADTVRHWIERQDVKTARGSHGRLAV